MAQGFDTTINNLIAGITAAVGPVDTRVGTVLRDAILAPAAFEFTNVYDNLDVVSANQGVNTASLQSDAALENLASNYGLSRFAGSYATGSVRFLRYTQPTTNIEIPVGTKVYTELSSVRVSFSTLATVYLTPSSPTEVSTGAYYVDCAVSCDDLGDIGNVVAGGISYVELVGIDAVYNPNETTSGKNVQTNEQLVSTIESTARGNVGTRTGYESIVRTNFSVEDVKIISGRDADAVRAQYGGTVDVIVLDEAQTPVTESFVFVNTATTTELVPTFKPLMGVSSITGTGVTGVDNVDVVLNEGATADFEVAYDTYSINRRSSIESSKVLLHYDAAAHGDTPLLEGSLLNTEYLYTANVPNIQNFFASDDNNVLGSDVMVKAGIEIPVNVTANIKIFPGYNSTSMVTSVTAALTTFFNSLLLDADIQASDVIAAIANVTGVDSVDITTFSLARVSNPGVPLQEILVNRQEYVRMQNAYITVIG